MPYAKSAAIEANQINSGWQAIESNNQPAYHSPVPQLIEMLEPILAKGYL